MGIGSKVSEKIKVLNDMLPVMKQFLKAHESACILLQCPSPTNKKHDVHYIKKKIQTHEMLKRMLT